MANRSLTTRWLLGAAAATVVIGGAGALIAAALLGLGLAEAARLTLTAGAASIAVGLVGAVVLKVLRGHTVAAQTTAVTLISIGAVAAGEMAAAHQMFVSSSPLAALVAVLVTAGAIGVLVSAVLGRRVGSGTEALAVAARRIGRGELPVAVTEPPTQELATLARELQAMSASLSRSTRREQSLQQSRRNLIAWVSHDLRTPIARIHAIVEALEDGLIGNAPEGTEYWARLRGEVDRLARLVEALFELSQLDAGVLRLELEDVVLCDLVSDVVVAAEPQAARRDIHLDVRLGYRAPIRLSAGHMERVLANLLDNAIRFTPAGGAVEVAVVREDRSAHVVVQDECGGIPAGDLGQLFEVGWSRERRGQRGEGSGLGLAIARGIVDAHGGSIGAENSGAGCRFSVTLPLADADQSASKR